MQNFIKENKLNCMIIFVDGKKQINSETLKATQHMKTGRRNCMFVKKN